jgi:hypothetical protein
MPFHLMGVVGLVMSLVSGAAIAAGGGAHGQASANLRPWNEYHVIMWVAAKGTKLPQHFPRYLERLQAMGVDTGMIRGAYTASSYYDKGPPSLYAANDFPYYVENIVNKGLNLEWNLPPNAPKKIANDWLGYMDAWVAAGRPKSGFKRPYSLDDPKWQAYAKRTMRHVAKLNEANAPLAYDIRDELSITRYANPFDWSYSPDTLAAFRAWLKTRYTDLAALNDEWQTHYQNWDDVVPFTTDQIKNRMASGKARPPDSSNWFKLRFMHYDPASARRRPTAWNFSPWADFRTYMDVSLARTLDSLRRQAHKADPHTPVGIEGTQMPSAWGGYDLYRLSRVLDWAEPYDIGDARAIWASFMGAKPILSTIFPTAGNQHKASRTLWHKLLMGDRGVIVWWSKTTVDLNDPDYPLTRRAKAIAPVLKAMKSPLANLFLRAKRVDDPIALVYSQPSLQATWLIESMADGPTWPRRTSSYDAKHSHAVKVRDAWLKALQDLGYSPRFIDASALADPRARGKFKAIVLPTTLALSPDEIEGLQQFLQNAGAPAGRALFADGEPGAFDEHARLRHHNPLTKWFAGTSAAESSVVRGSGQSANSRNGDIADYRQQRLGGDMGWAKWIAGALPGGMTPAVRVGQPANKVRVHRYRLGKAWLIALERNYSQNPNNHLDQSTLKQPLTTSVSLSDAMPHWYVYNLRTQKRLGQVRQWKFTLKPWQPSLYALWPDKVPDGQIVSVLMQAG